MGFFHTDIMSGISHNVEAAVSAEAAENVLKTFANSSALGRLGDPAEVEGIVQLLASEAGSFITGASIAIDGGLSIVMCPDPLGL
jgi:NAD(P)-dependent dehydrogenase (short-subunit alcohol dehydrogenase family)